MPPKEDKILAELLIQRKGLYAIRDAIEKFIENYNPDRDSCQLSVRIESLDRVNADFLKAQDAIDRLDKMEMLDDYINDRVDFEQRFCEAKGFLLSRRNPEFNQSVLNTSMTAHAPLFSSSFHLRLPRIDLPKFNGDFSRWLSFRDTFTSMVHSNGDMPMVAKLQYLLQSLEGEAKKPFESVDIEADNYSSTWETLNKRYDNRRFLKRQLFRALQDLPSVKQESSHHLHNLVDDFQRHVRALGKLEEPVNCWDTPLIYMLTNKLDTSTIRAWEERTSQQDDVKYEELIDFLYQRVRILNSVAPSSVQIDTTKVAGTNSKFSRVKFTANAATSVNSDVPCMMGCPESHALRICPVFLGKNIYQRKELVSQKKLCWNCLSLGHQAKKCISKYTCRICHDRHHSLLHDTNSYEPSSNAVPVSNQPQFPSTSSSFSHASQQISMSVITAGSMVLLETVVLNVVDDDGKKHEVRALLDSASTSNFMTRQLANVLCKSRSKADISVAGIGFCTQRVEDLITTTIESKIQPFSTKLEFLILEQLSAELPCMPIDISRWKLPDITLADPKFYIPGKIDLVIGSETFWELHSGRKFNLGKGLPWITETPFGWTASGSTSNEIQCSSKICNLSTVMEHEAQLQRAREIENIPSNSSLFNEENLLKVSYKATTTRSLIGRYDVRLPERVNQEIVLGNSRIIAEHSQLEHMVKIESSVDGSKPNYNLPYQAVLKETCTSTMDRSIFNASCKTSCDYSLNNTLNSTIFDKYHSLIKLPATEFSWTSSGVIQWLPSSTNRWITCIYNRLSLIQLPTKRDRWKHIPEINHSTDDISSILNAGYFMNWWKGPPWLSKPSNFWHQPTRFAEESDITTGERHNAAVTTLTNIEFCWCNTLLAQYSSFGKLGQVVKCCMRYLNRLRELATLHRSSILEHKYKKTSVHSSVPKQQEAEEIIDHQKTKRESNSTVPRRSHSFVGTANIILNGGRLQNAKIRRRPIYPTVMDNNNFFITNLAFRPRNGAVRVFQGSFYPVALIALFPTKSSTTISS